jgi:hypothetical protein
MSSPRELAQHPKELVDSDAIAKGEVKIEHLSPGLYGEVRMIKAHAHEGGTSRRITHNGIEVSSDLFSKALINYQTVTTNTINQSDLKIQTGWTYITGDGASSAMSTTVTYPEAFSSIITVITGNLGRLVGSNPTSIGSFNATSGHYVQAINVGASTFSFVIVHRNGTALGATSRYGGTWLAIGVK